MSNPVEQEYCAQPRGEAQHRPAAESHRGQTAGQPHQQVGSEIVRVDKTANLHVPIGKVSFETKKLYENLAALMDAIKKARPAAAKGTYIKRVSVTTTMGPGIKVDPIQAQSMEAID